MRELEESRRSTSRVNVDLEGNHQKLEKESTRKIKNRECKIRIKKSCEIW